MCAILGIFNAEKGQIEKGLELMKDRGIDGKNTKKLGELTIGHRLHKIVGNVSQPLKKKGIFAANCEIYNWQELNEKYKLKAKNDADTIFKLLEKIEIEEVLNLLDGVYAFAYYKDNKLILARDILGVKPLFYDRISKAFASEKKALIGLGFSTIEELNPRKLFIDGKLIDREFFKISPEHEDKYEVLKKRVKELFLNAVKKRIPKTKVGILFSGGIDSTIIAKTLKDLNIDFTCYTAGFWEDETKEPEDIIYAKRVAKDLNLKLNVKYIQREEVEKYLKKIVPLIEDSNAVKVAVALPFYVASEMAKEDDVKVLFSGLGSEEIFAGYQRHKEALNINKECLHGLRMMYERDLYRDDVVTMNNNIELRLPFLDKALVEYALKIPSKFKLNEESDKMVIRDIAQEIHVPLYISKRGKKAAQYGSRFDNAIKKLAKGKKRTVYLKQFLNKPNLKLGVLFSSGKDSCYALHLMKEMNYEISCLITLKSKNPSSYMFHTPNINLASLQAEAMDIPIILQETEGEKEEELEDLKLALEKAKETYEIDGIVTGALYSTYQRDRIEKIAEELQLKVFSPLWHIDQEQEMRSILEAGFEVILSSIAADGLDKSWVGVPITQEHVDKLVKLNETIGINIAGEGGEFESLVINASFFKKKIVVKESEIISESENTAFFKIKDAILE